MRDILETWQEGISYLLGDDLISFYTFFTVIFAECAYLWAFEITSTAIWLTIVLLAHVVNVMVFSWLKGFYEGMKQEVLVSRFYIINFAVLVIIGCIINFWLNIMLTAIAVVITFWWIVIRDFQDSCYVGYNRIITMISKLFYNKIFWIFSQIVVIGLPFVAFAWFLALIPTLPLLFKVIIPTLYFIFIPFISCIEDEFAACNIFEIAYEITWDETFEEMKIDKNNK